MSGRGDRAEGAAREEAERAISTVELRRMQAGDLRQVLRLEQATFTMPWTEETFRGLLRRTDTDLYVAAVHREIVGYAAFWAVLEQGELGNLAIAPAWRGKGIGRALLLQVLSRAVERGVKEVFLEVRISNLPARRLYEGHGFRQVGRRRNYYRLPVEDALVLCKPIAP